MPNCQNGKAQQRELLALRSDTGNPNLISFVRDLSVAILI